MTDYTIRNVSTDDWRLLRETRLRALADAPDAFSSLLHEDQARPESAWRVRAADREVAQFVALSPAGGSVGMAVGAPHTSDDVSAGLFGMWVAPEARECGVGRALVEAVVAWARENGYGRVLLDVGDTNRAAIRLYESCGFRATGVTGTLPPPREHVLEHERALLLGDRESGGVGPECGFSHKPS